MGLGNSVQRRFAIFCNAWHIGGSMAVLVKEQLNNTSQNIPLSVIGGIHESNLLKSSHLHSMWPVEPALVAVIRRALQTDLPDVCARCHLRLAGVKDSRIYERVGKKKTEATAVIQQQQQEQGVGDNDDDLAPPAKKAKEESVQPCRACIGILQNEIMVNALDKVCQSIVNCGYDADHFTIAVSLPASLALRGQSVNVYLSELQQRGDKELAEFDAADVVPIKQVWKWLFSKRVQERVGKRYATGDYCEFFVEMEIVFAEDEKELKCLQSMCKEEYKMRQKKQNVYHMGLVTRQGAEKSLASVSSKTFRLHYPVPPSSLADADSFEANVNMYHNSIFMAGRYNKYSRDLPQTPWIVDGEKRMESSVEELIIDRVRPFFTFDQTKFSSSGREDVDVRMLGRGRPFLFEITNPRKTKFGQAEMEEIAKRINDEGKGDIWVRDLQIVHKSSIKALKEGEDQKKKTYTALCVTPTPIELSFLQTKLDSIQNLELEQSTPIRVLHRRPNAIRRRTVYNMKTELLVEGEKSSNTFKVTLSTQAGTYVKEFVHGDFQRTRPNMREILGCDVDIIALDVEAIDLDWPPAL